MSIKMTLIETEIESDELDWSDCEKYEVTQIENVSKIRDGVKILTVVAIINEDSYNLEVIKYGDRGLVKFKFKDSSLWYIAPEETVSALNIFKGLKLK